MEKQAFDLLIVTDATASMGRFITALNKSLPEIISLSALTGSFDRIGVVAYRDYCLSNLTEWSGWCSPSGAVEGPDIVSQEQVLKMAANIKADSGRYPDWPEAAKTGLALAYEQMREDATTIILTFSDAPPHLHETSTGNLTKEKKALNEKGSYGGTGYRFVDWVSACNTLREGPKKAVVFSIVAKGDIGSWSAFLFLSTLTNGTCFCLKSTNAEIISQLTVGILLTWMGAGEALAKDTTVAGFIKSYNESSDLLSVGSEADPATKRYYGFRFNSNKDPTIAENISSQELTLNMLPSCMQIRGPNISNFAKRYVTDVAYKKLAVDQLRRIISTNVSTISYNPIFGSLWRAVCSDRGNEARDGLITLFGSQVDRITDTAEKTRMKLWLEESYNYAAEVQAAIAEIPADQRFPLLFLDPTADFGVSEGRDDDEDSRPLNKFTRGELLEIGRSCDYRILRRLGKVLTRLTYIEKPEDLPAHIKNANEEEVPQIPMVLADPEHNRKFWKMLLHAVLPGTMIGARPAAVLAALALRMGIVPLRDAADQELLAFRDKWNSLDIPETWNLGCLGLLLDADRDYEKRVADGVTKRATPDASILKEEDRNLFKTLVDYKMLEMNLHTSLQAKISWRPEKTKVALGPVVVCRKCRFPRSVTMMGPGGFCGMCTMENKGCKCEACTPSTDHKKLLRNNVSRQDSESSLGSWVECSRADCRAQYVIYNPSLLVVRPKCFYCRHSNRKDKHIGTAPLVECSKCLSRIVWPEEYRPKGMDLTKFECSACKTDVVTVITQEITPEALSHENGKEWLLRNDDNAIDQPFNGRSLFFTASHCDLANLTTKVEVLPANDVKITIAGKPVQNFPDIMTALSNWVLSRRAESGVCSLCFSNIRKADLRRACGRKGCDQLVCSGCTKDWYGLNDRGRIINVAALCCPFCRRRPAPKAINAFGIANMGNLRLAVEEAGSWIYAWCRGCGFAKPYIERACAAGPPPELTHWDCDECKKPEAKLQKQRQCPGCGVVTEKMGGCDHITCPCGTHWCYACGEEPGDEGIYPHIERVHGGLGFDVDDEYDDDDEYYDDE